MINNRTVRFKIDNQSFIKKIFKIWFKITKVSKRKKWRSLCISACKFKIERVDYNYLQRFFNLWKKIVFQQRKSFYNLNRISSPQFLSLKKSAILMKEIESKENILEYLRINDQSKKKFLKKIFDSWSMIVFKRHIKRSQIYQADSFHQYNLQLVHFILWKESIG